MMLLYVIVLMCGILWFSELVYTPVVIGLACLLHVFS